jgi:predicted metalloprotease with PDZ domain
MFCGRLGSWALVAVTIAVAVGAYAEPKPPVPAPRDVPYPGNLTLKVDATDIQRRIFRIHETIPVRPGHLVLQYAKWLPGNHAPSGPIDQLAGPYILAGGKQLDWYRDTVDVYSFHLNVPGGIHELQIDLQFASPEVREQGRIVMTSQILGLQWEKTLLYPAGYYLRDIKVEPSVTLPSGWQYGSALDGGQREGDTVHFAVAPLDTLFDSPLLAGSHFKRVDLDTGGKAPVRLDVAADSDDELNIPPEALAAHKKLVSEATTVFASRHFDHYDFLLSISEDYSGIGLEHHRSSEDGVTHGYFKDWAKSEPHRDLLAHEMTHSWNGKFRRPADLWTPTLNVPMQDSLLWVYEGQTQYWGYILAARSGLWSPELARGAIASVAATFKEERPGRSWRNLQDTTNQPIITPRRPLSWVSWQRAEDYYQEGALIWLDADTRLRELTGGKRSLDDFARGFFGVRDGSYEDFTYTFDDVVKALNAVAPADWAQFLRARLDNHSDAPLQGIDRSGWRLVFRDTPSGFSKKADDDSESTDRRFSIGITLDKEARIGQVVWDSPAFKAGLVLGSTVIAVDGLAYKKDLLDAAILAAHDPGKPVELLVRDQERYRMVKLDYTGGPRYPDLERIAGAPDMLAEILKPRT